MLVVDGNRLKLLRMKEKLLEVSMGNNKQVLSEYKDIVISIDKDMYEELINMIRNTNYRNQSLEEQLVFFNNLEREYNSYSEFQCKYKNIYAMYAPEVLELSSLDNIYIDRIKEKIAAISGYLINKNNLLKYRDSIEKYNVELVEAEKKKEAIVSKFLSLEQSLVDNVLNAEGRVYNNDNLEYASIIKEYDMNGLNLGTLLKDSNLLKESIPTVENLVLSENEKVKTASLCCYRAPNDSDMKKLYEVSVTDLLKASYKLILLKIADLLQKKFNDYVKIKNKRTEIISLISERKSVLRTLGIKYYVDPFDKIKINNQLEIIELLGGNIQNVAFIKEKIKDAFNVVDDIKAKNEVLIKVISKNSELFNDIKDEDISYVSNVVDAVSTTVEHDDNTKVIRVKEPSKDINYDLIHVKTNGVVARVYEMLTSTNTLDIKQDIVPDLVVVKDAIFDDMVDDGETIFESKSTEQVIPEDIKIEETNVFEEVKPFEETVLFTDKADDAFLKEEVKVLEKQNDVMSELSVTNNQEFLDNIGDVFLEDAVSKEQTDVMPELSVTNTEEVLDKVESEDINSSEENSKVLSLDEQVEALYNNDFSKIRTRAA